MVIKITLKFYYVTLFFLTLALSWLKKKKIQITLLSPKWENSPNL